MTIKKKPNILVLWGDDIGQFNISAYNRGMMGYKTPNIDRIANEGALFTDWYGQQSCTAGRAAFITGQSPMRTGLTKVGLPGAPEGMKIEDPTIAGLLKAQGYVTGQFGKNHLGDADSTLPSNHGFDEFFGNLYHLNAEEEPEHPDYPKEADFPNFKKNFGPRGVIHSFAGGKVTDTGPLTKKRMETIDDEATERAKAFIEAQVAEDKPFFVWYNTTGMHFRTHRAEKHKGKSNGQGVYADVMVAHDENIGVMLDLLDTLGIADNTIVMYSTDNGPHFNSWPDAGITPFRSEKNTNWEGGWRVPAFLRWPGHIPAGSVVNGIVSHQDMLPTFLAAAGDDTVNDKLLAGHQIGSMTYNVCIDGFNMLPYLTGQAKESPRNSFVYMSDDGDVIAIRIGDYKCVLAEQRATKLQCWIEPFVKLRGPKLFNLRQDPFERADESSNTYWDWYLDHVWVIYGMQDLVASMIPNFVKYPPRQKPASFNLDSVLEGLNNASGGANH